MSVYEFQKITCFPLTHVFTFVLLEEDISGFEFYSSVWIFIKPDKYEGVSRRPETGSYAPISTSVCAFL